LLSSISGCLYDMCWESFFWGADRHPGTGHIRKYRLSTRLRLGTLSVSESLLTVMTGSWPFFELLSLVDNSPVGLSLSSLEAMTEGSLPFPRLLLFLIAVCAGVLSSLVSRNLWSPQNGTSCCPLLPVERGGCNPKGNGHWTYSSWYCCIRLTFSTCRELWWLKASPWMRTDFNS